MACNNDNMYNLINKLCMDGLRICLPSLISKFWHCHPQIISVAATRWSSCCYLVAKLQLQAVPIVLFNHIRRQCNNEEMKSYCISQVRNRLAPCFICFLERATQRVRCSIYYNCATHDRNCKFMNCIAISSITTYTCTVVL